MSGIILKDMDRAKIAHELVLEAKQHLLALTTEGTITYDECKPITDSLFDVQLKLNNLVLSKLEKENKP